MNSPAKPRLPAFELSIFVVMFAIGWALFRLYQVAPRAHQDQQATQQVEAMQALAKAEVAKHDLWKVIHEFSNLAVKVEQSIDSLRDSLTRYVNGKTRSDLERFLTESEALKGWLKKERDRTDLRQSQEAQRLALQNLSLTNRSAPVFLDAGVLLEKMDQAFGNYHACFEKKPGQNLLADSVQNRWDKAKPYEEQMLNLARQARGEAMAMEILLQPGSDEFAEPAPLDTKSPTAKLLRLQSELQPVGSALTAALVGLGVFLMAAIYRRMVVAPLRLKLVESNTILEQQKKLDHFAQLAAALAHEIRNPLTAIRARLYTLQKTLEDGSAEHKDAAVIQSEIMRLDKIVKDFLNLARPSKPTLVPMQADSTLREVKDLLAPQCKRQAIELKCDYMDSALFCADPQQLKQVLINLVQNAADSIGQDGTITMRARRGKARLNGGPADAVVLEVEDTGPGIPLEVQERLFDPFFSTKTDGTGLGLPIAARIIDKHGGNLDFESEAGRGTIFRVTLPVHQPA